MVMIPDDDKMGAGGAVKKLLILAEAAWADLQDIKSLAPLLYCSFALRQNHCFTMHYNE